MTALRRTFFDVKESNVDTEEAQLVARMGFSSDIDWDDLLKSKRILIISEAGSGKSFECKARRDLLWAEGQAAFYIELEGFAQAGLRAPLSQGEVERFDRWESGEIETATFFLDSIDELKLSLKSFEATLKQFAKAIGRNLDRVRLVFTSRPGPDDRQLIRRHLPIPEPLSQRAEPRNFADIMVTRSDFVATPPEPTAKSDFRCVGMAPLSNRDIQQFAVNDGITDPGQMFAAIVARDALEFARSPHDLVALCSDWREGRIIRSSREQAGRNAEVKLAPREDRREAASLSFEKACEGACRVALATFLTRRFGIRHSPGGEIGAALDPSIILTDWTKEEQKTLLERPMFPFASYGRVRFHHRSTAEFLAAERLHHLLSRGMAVRALKRLLFADTFEGIKVIRPRMRPIAVWLAAINSSVFQEVLEREPEVLFIHADPSVLDPEQRKQALRAFVKMYGQGAWRGMHVPRRQVRRFGSLELAADVQSLWAEGIQNPEVREFLLDLVGAVPLPSCTSIAASAAADDREKEDVRLAAIRALAKIDPTIAMGLVDSMVVDSSNWPDSIVRFAIPLLFPKHMNVDQLLRLVSRQKASGRAYDSFEWMLGDAISGAEIDTHDLVTLCSGLKALVFDGIERGVTARQVSTKRRDLILSLADVCLRLLERKQIDLIVLEASFLVIKVAEQSHRTEKRVQSLRAFFAMTSEDIREKLFWLSDCINENLRARPDPWNRLWAAVFQGPITLNFQQDQGWVTRTLADTNKPTIERQMMLYASTNLMAHESQDRTVFLNDLRIHISDVPLLVSQLDSQLITLPMDPENAKFEAENRLRAAEAEKKKEEGRQAWADFQRRLKEDPVSSFNGAHEKNTAWNLWLGMRRSNGKRDDIEWNPGFVEEHFGPDVLARLRMAMRSAWRNERPTLRFERSPEERDTFWIGWQFGLAALFAEAEDPTWASKLTVADAELAARYAPIQLNGFAPWLEALVEAHPAAVERTLGPDLVAELDAADTKQSASVTLQNVRHAPAQVAKIFVPLLKNWLSCNYRQFVGPESDPPILGRLWQVADILIFYDSDAPSWLIPVAEDALSRETSSGSATFWLNVVFRLDPSKGADAFERQLSKVEPSRDGPAIGWFAALFGDSREPSVELSHADFTPELLARLVRLSYRYVRPSDDIIHDGVFSPGPKDDAQSARNRLLTAILNAKGPEAWRLKLDLAKDPLFAHFRDRLAQLARERLAEEIDSEEMTEADVAALGRNLEAPPRTRDEMFALLKDRLDDLDDLLGQDVSPRELWAEIKVERIMRRAISYELKQSARGAYTVDQEAATADEKETDIRLRSTAPDHQAVIELKIGESWSGRVLRETLRDQIVEKYMEPENCRSGCLMVTIAKNRTWEDPDTGKPLDVNGLRLMLEFEAKKIEAKTSHSVRLLVKILDLRPRQSRT